MDLRQRIEQLKAKRGLGPAPAEPGTAERLKRLLDTSPRREPTGWVDDAEVAARLGGVAPAPGLVLVEERLPLDHCHGRVPLSALLDAPLEALAEPIPHPEQLLFLDTETTGLAGGTGTLPFLLGLARLEDGGLRMRQYFLTGFSGEQALLNHARAWLESAEHVVTYNGKSFDVPLLVTRHRLRRLACPLEGKQHIDLLHPTRTAFGGRWPDCRLQRAEVELLGVARRDDLPGWLVPQVWSEFVRNGRMGDVPRILEHNRFDVITLVALLAEMSRIHAVPGYREADPHALAKRHLRSGQHDKALEHLEAGRETLNTEGLLELARQYRRLGRWEDALDIWQPLARHGVIQALLALAKFHEHVSRDYASGLAVCQELLARQPDNDGHRRRLARLMSRQHSS